MRHIIDPALSWTARSTYQAGDMPLEVHVRLTRLEGLIAGETMTLPVFAAYKDALNTLKPNELEMMREQEKYFLSIARYIITKHQGVWLTERLDYLFGSTESAIHPQLARFLLNLQYDMTTVVEHPYAGKVKLASVFGRSWRMVQGKNFAFKTTFNDRKELQFIVQTGKMSPKMLKQVKHIVRSLPHNNWGVERCFAYIRVHVDGKNRLLEENLSLRARDAINIVYRLRLESAKQIGKSTSQSRALDVAFLEKLNSLVAVSMNVYAKCTGKGE